MTKVLALFATAALQMCAAPHAMAASCEDGATNMSEIRACLTEQNGSAVEEAYAALSLRLKARMPRASAALEESQRNWVQFVRSSCDFYAEFNAATSIRQDALANCMADFSRARIKVLKAWESQLDRRP